MIGIINPTRKPVTEFRVSDAWWAVLALRPETGMGYQLCTVFLKTGYYSDDIIVPDVLVLSDGTLMSDRKFVEKDILGFCVHAGPRSKLK